MGEDKRETEKEKRHKILKLKLFIKLFIVFNTETLLFSHKIIKRKKICFTGKNYEKFM